jgi:uncharacterized protein YqgC (DUF456 family)
MPFWGELLVASALLVAAVGVVIPLLPGALLAALAIAVWAIVVGGWAWAVLALALAILALGQVVKYVWPGRRLTRSGVPMTSIMAGGLLGIVGFFVIPVVGLPIGFVAGVYGAERLRLSSNTALPSHEAAWRSTVEAMKATGLSILVELASVLVVSALWFAAAVVI